MYRSGTERSRTKMSHRISIEEEEGPFSSPCSFGLSKESWNFVPSLVIQYSPFSIPKAKQEDAFFMPVNRIHETKILHSYCRL